MGDSCTTWADISASATAATTFSSATAPRLRRPCMMNMKNVTPIAKPTAMAATMAATTPVDMALFDIVSGDAALGSDGGADCIMAPFLMVGDGELAMHTGTDGQGARMHCTF